MDQNISNIDFSKSNGIVPVIVQDTSTKEILMQNCSGSSAAQNEDSTVR